MLEVYGADCLDSSNISRWCRFFEEGCQRSTFQPTSDRCNTTQLRPVYVIDVYKLTPSNGPKERSRRARDLTVASDNLSAIEFRPGDFFFNVEPVIRNEASHRKIVFRVGILA
ncbi:hypothetical protein ANN_21750 [Periplaneta americana]|uniref:Uncharacterized protein n=1 Tax=Periplaneta americana TaxID=6978 RepID=A0ABQ8S6L8_PERAM|nr:hypothetical protein ANN_21750 [Periplaneta americana]